MFNLNKMVFLKSNNKIVLIKINKLDSLLSDIKAEDITLKSTKNTILFE